MTINDLVFDLSQWHFNAIFTKTYKLMEQKLDDQYEKDGENAIHRAYRYALMPISPSPPPDTLIRS